MIYRKHKNKCLERAVFGPDRVVTRSLISTKNRKSEEFEENARLLILLDLCVIIVAKSTRFENFVVVLGPIALVVSCC